MSTMKGVGLKLASTLVFSVMSIVVREQTQLLPVGEVMFFRASFGLIPVVAWLWASGDLPGALYTPNPMGHLVRSGLSVIAMGLWFGGLSLTPIGEAQAIVFSTPLMVVGLAAWWLHETVGLGRWLAVIAGFGGILVILSEHFDEFSTMLKGGAALGVVVVFLSAIASAIATIFVRHLIAKESTGAIVFYFTLLISLMSLATLPFGWAMPHGWQWAHLALMGLCGGVGQVLLTASFRYAAASILAPLDYINLIWVVALAFLMFGEIPTWTVVGGALIVVLSGVYVVMPRKDMHVEATQ